ncbi:hypothetical protein CBS101457_002024 [Exobasidium rhododendri]|nr:hypothetical protein CBS101457_002024 [Exobasidium rhododendri]
MGNSAGLFGVLTALFRPGLVVPQVIVPDITHLDWVKLKEAGVAHVLFDKDNCITRAHEDSIIPELQASWYGCTHLGFTTILIVSNSAGSSDDPLGVGAEYLSQRLGQLVLAHPSKKPSKACAKQILEILTRRQDGRDSIPGHIMMIGDRISTDIILASRMQRLLQKRKSTVQVIGTLTTTVHSSERVGTRAMRALEMWVLGRLVRMGIMPGSNWRGSKGMNVMPTDWQQIATGTSRSAQSLSVSKPTEEKVDLPPLIPLGQRIRNLPSRFGGAVLLAGYRGLSWLGDGWLLINDGVRLGTKGFIGTPDPGLRRIRMNPDQAPTQSKPRSALSLSSSLQPRSKALHPPSSRHYSSRASKAIPSRAAPPKPRIHGWPSAFAALILIPTCWYGGVMLHEWRNQRETVDEVEKNLVSTKKESAIFREARSTAGPPTMPFAPQQSQTLLTTRFHLERELNDIDEKLHRLESRSRPQQTKANTPTSSHVI